MSIKARIAASLASVVNSKLAEFTHDYTIEQLTKTPDGQGGFTQSWATFAVVKGFVSPADNDEDKQHKKFSFEYVSGIDASMRLLYGGEYYNIISVESVAESTLWITIIASRNTAT